MRLYLVQHGEAFDKAANPDRPLTPEGQATVERMGRFLAGHGLNIPEVWHSGKCRARETAEHLAIQVAQSGTLIERGGLNPKDPIEPVFSALEHRQDDLMIIGHLPFLEELAGKLIAGDKHRSVIAFHYASVLCLERNESNGWTVCWMVLPELL